MPSKQKKTVFQSGELTNWGSGPDSAQVSSEAAQTFDILNNSSTYANPTIFYGSKIPSVSEKSLISSWHVKSLSVPLSCLFSSLWAE